MKPRYRIILTLMSISLIGIIAVQFLWIDYAIKKEKSVFDKMVYDALKSVSGKLENEEVFVFMNHKIDLPPPPDVFFEHDDIDSIIQFRVGKSMALAGSGSHTVHSNNGNTVIIYGDSSSDGNSKYKIETRINYDSDDVDEDIEVLINREMKENRKQLDSLRLLADLQREKEKIVEEKLQKFQKNIKQWVYEFNYEDNRVDFLSHRSNTGKILKQGLLQSGIDLDFVYQIISEDGDKYEVLRSNPDTTTNLKLKYKTALFPNDFFGNKIKLSIDFPEASTMIYKKVAVLILGSLLFTIIILITFGFTIYYIQKQKKISEIKSDFINNMTHEFKTPIATISLASSAIESPKVIGNSEKTSYYVDLIKKENKRMNSQVERVLQMAQIDRDDFNLKLETVDVHEIIENVAAVLSMRAEDKGGRIICSLKASCNIIEADEVHFANLVNNLIDNALKYNENPPEILLETSSAKGKFILSVSDNGIGMSKEVQKHIFDKFYRKPSGNIHNIKGFGLGLSYVKAICDAHDGEISVQSEAGHGSKFTLTFKCKE